MIRFHWVQDGSQFLEVHAVRSVGIKIAIDDCYLVVIFAEGVAMRNAHDVRGEDVAEKVRQGGFAGRCWTR